MKVFSESSLVLVILRENNLPRDVVDFKDLIGTTFYEFFPLFQRELAQRWSVQGYFGDEAVRCDGYGTPFGVFFGAAEAGAGFEVEVLTAGELHKGDAFFLGVFWRGGGRGGGTI